MYLVSLLFLFFLFFFFKQKTAYEMRISDWSSDVCSSDLVFLPNRIDRPEFRSMQCSKQRSFLIFRLIRKGNCGGAAELFLFQDVGSALVSSEKVCAVLCSDEGLKSLHTSEKAHEVIFSAESENGIDKHVADASPRSDERRVGKEG